VIYDITLSISYEYASRADAGRHALRLMPAVLRGEQRLIAGSLRPDPVPDERSDRTDFFGNRVIDLAYKVPVSQVEFLVQARVDRMASPTGLDISPPLNLLANELDQVRSLAADEPVHYLGKSPRIAPGGVFAEYASDITDRSMSVLLAVESIGKALHRDMKFDSKATSVETTALEAFTNRHGVCQDFSHVMISCLRSIGIPAGYVSGFLRTIPPEGMERLEGADAMHAWVRAWCGFEVGWIEYDPTNAIHVGTDHIVVARGRDYSDIAPVKGVMRTAGGQSTKHAVDVVPV